ncbi:glycosyltransferase involved in cell wall biosynthesis [Mucilaginibacter frigoritolerans]|jgi:glycosyltransferase involved in cell wall biosynthesis|uniref:Glycosyltransferase involved in cell wall biosynthesis n=1 Tax=Mucilaginibacter frigoritolerans TaxID=652788 RepID=A0A562U4Q8_9SPHI|nr:glycosyltransferase [Mucilaginibacter frigoritolerans]TWJ00790.1 glycosyltransferase involved in cell wall biosynthesis [Mucilaginibacter frigoritolerans]
MNLLHVITSMSPENGGPAQGIRTLNNAMLGMGVIREVACVDAPDSAYLGKDEFKIHALGPAKGPWCYSPELIDWLKSNILRFDVVMINGLWLYQSYAAWKVLKKLKKETAGKPFPRILVMPHGMLDPYFQRASGRKLKAIRNWLYWKLIESKVVNDADGLLFTCETELLLARETFKPYRPKKEYNVGYGVATPQPYNDNLSLAFNQLCPGLNGSPYLLFLSRVHQKKGVDLLLNAYISLHKRLANKNMPKLVIAGPGLDTPFGIMIQQLLENEPEIKKDVFFPGMLTGDAKWGAFYGCEAFVLPSHQENFGIAVVEALACGKPVLISNQVNIWREIMDSGGGLICDDTISGIKNILEKWISLDAAEKVKESNCALNTYQQLFTTSKAASNFFNAFINHNPI